MIEFSGVKIEWLGHAGFRVEGPPTVYLDPFQVSGGPEADLILITHDHYDHCDPDSVRRVAGPGTVVLAGPGCGPKLRGLSVREVRPGDELEVKGVRVRAVPAYNVRPERLRFHPREKGYVGFVVELSGVKVYHAGDTDLIPEMEGLQPDVALLPVSGTYVMDAEEAARAVELIRPRLAVPMHYGAIVGSRRDAERFASLVRTCEVRIPG